MPAIGKTLSHYRILDEISRGGARILPVPRPWKGGDLDRALVEEAERKRL